jgi:hypothetical protein
MEQMRAVSILTNGMKIYSTSFEIKPKENQIIFSLDGKIQQTEPLSNILCLWGLSLEGLNDKQKITTISNTFFKPIKPKK